MVRFNSARAAAFSRPMHIHCGAINHSITFCGDTIKTIMFSNYFEAVKNRKIIKIFM